MFTKLQTKDLKTEDRVNAFVDKFDDIQELLNDFAQSEIQLKLQNPRLNNNLYGSIAYNIATRVCNLSKNDHVLVEECDVEDMLLTK